MDAPELRPLFTRKLSRRQLIAVDGLAAVAYTVILVTFMSADRVAKSGPSVPVWAQFVIVAGMGLPAAVRRLWPRAVFGVVLVTALVSVLLGVVSDSFVAAAFALYMVALTQPRRRWEPTLAIGLLSAAAVVGMAAVGPRTASWTVIPLGSAVMGGTWTVGRAVRERRAYAARSAAQLAGRAVTEERLRIARELHDIVAHGMSLIAVKAGVANHVLPARPEEAHDALRVIEATSRSALTEMRHLLGVLRSEAGATETPASLDPTPGVGGLRGLAERAAMAGVRVSMDVRGVSHLPEGLGLSVYRIVQEALTNVVRHAAPARCRVLIDADGRAVRIEVADDGPGHRELPEGERPAPGHGLVGMRERVAMYGGVFTAGPRPEGGFEVTACLPYGPMEEAR
jgi:signal transduction histidine kinase